MAYDPPDYLPFVDRHVPDRVLWGDTHLHTRLSVDTLLRLMDGSRFEVVATEPRK